MQHSLFALELCIRMVPGSTVHDALARCVPGAPPAMSLTEKWQQHSRAASILMDTIGLAERGCWDYWNDNSTALEAFKDWGSLSSEGLHPAYAHGAGPYRGDPEPRYLTFTLALLLVNGSQSDRMLGLLSSVPEADYWTRATFVQLLRGVGAVSFASVKSDVLCLVPRDDGWGLTLSDLQQPKYGYLRPLL